MAVAQVSTSISLPIQDVCSFSSGRRVNSISGLPTSCFLPNGSTFTTGTRLLRTKMSQRSKSVSRATSLTIKCEQRTQEGNGLDVWLGRLAMVGFAVAISVEIATGKGLLENFGLTTPLPTVALAVTGLVGVLTAVFIFQSASKN